MSTRLPEARRRTKHLTQFLDSTAGPGALALLGCDLVLEVVNVLELVHDATLEPPRGAGSSINELPTEESAGQLAFLSVNEISKSPSRASAIFWSEVRVAPTWPASMRATTG